MSQKPNSDNLSENRVPKEDDVLSEHQKSIGQETRESPNISNQIDQLENAAKAGEIDEAEKILDQNIESAQNAYFNHSSVSNPDVHVQWVLKESFIDSQEDLKNYAGKVKSGKEINHSNGGKQMMSAQFEDANQKTSQFVNMIIDFLKKMDDLRMQVVGKMKSEGGRKVILGVLLIAGFIGLAVSVMAGMRNAQSSTEVSQGSNQVNNNPLEFVAVTQITSKCNISFTNPINKMEITNFGPVLFEWTHVPEAYSYSLEVVPPAKASLPWVYSANDNSKKVYMENFPMGGTFLVSVNALSEDKDVLCSATLRFDKSAFAGADKDKQDNNYSDNNEPASTSCATTGIAYICQ
jgi:hypothetical protein